MPVGLPGRLSKGAGTHLASWLLAHAILAAHPVDPSHDATPMPPTLRLGVVAEIHLVGGTVRRWHSRASRSDAYAAQKRVHATAPATTISKSPPASGPPHTCSGPSLATLKHSWYGA